MTITDSLSATGVDSFVVAQPALLTLAIAITAPSCPVLADGKAVANPTGGTAPFAYVWSNAATTDSLENISEGAVSVTTTDANGCMAQAMANITAPCQVPTGQGAKFIQDTSVTLQWDTTCGAIAYRIYYRVVGTTSWSIASKSVNKGQKLITGLTPNSKYMWRIQAKCASTGWSNLTSSSFFTTLDAPCIIPNNLSTTPIRHDMARANWTQQPGAWKYRIRWRETGGSWLTVLQDSVNNKYWMTGLTPATAHEWQVKTLCDCKDTTSGTQWSAVQTFTTDPTPKWGEDELRSADELAAIFSLFPNPSHTRLVNLAVEGSVGTDCWVEVMNSVGAIVLRHRLNTASGQLMQLDLAGQPAGMYLVRVTGSNLLFTQKLILK